MMTCPAMMLGGGSYFEKWFLALMVQFLGYVDMAHETVDCSDCNQSGVTKKTAVNYTIQSSKVMAALDQKDSLSRTDREPQAENGSPKWLVVALVCPKHTKGLSGSKASKDHGHLCTSNIDAVWECSHHDAMIRQSHLHMTYNQSIEMYSVILTKILPNQPPVKICKDLKRWFGLIWGLCYTATQNHQRLDCALRPQEGTSSGLHGDAMSEPSATDQWDFKGKARGEDSGTCQTMSKHVKLQLCTTLIHIDPHCTTMPLTSIDLIWHGRSASKPTPSHYVGHCN